MYKKEFAQSRARQAFRYLKRGVGPPANIEFFTVGLSRELSAIKGALKLTSDGGPISISHFLEAPYGYGKSHLLNVIKSMALEQKFGVAQITHDSYERAFNHPARYIQYLYESFLVPGYSTLGLGEIVARLLRSDRKNSMLRWADKSSIRWGIGYYIRRMAASPDSQDTFSLKYHINCCDIQYRGGAYFHLLYEKLASAKGISEIAMKMLTLSIVINLYLTFRCFVSLR